MGSFWSTHAPIKGRADIGKNHKAAFEEVLSDVDIDLFKAAVQNCVSISAGVTVDDVHILELTRSTQNGGISVLYSVGDLYQFIGEPDIKGQISRSILSGEFTANMIKFGVSSASATRDINAAYIRVDASAESGGALVLIINQVSDVFNQLSTSFSPSHQTFFSLRLHFRALPVCSFLRVESTKTWCGPSYPSDR